MCGEHDNRDMYRELAVGSSPHVRGAHHRRGEFVLAWGIIPACAGSTVGRAYRFIPFGDHPRMCGEHPSAG